MSRQDRQRTNSTDGETNINSRQNKRPWQTRKKNHSCLHKIVSCRYGPSFTTAINHLLFTIQDFYVCKIKTFQKSRAFCQNRESQCGAGILKHCQSIILLESAIWTTSFSQLPTFPVIATYPIAGGGCAVTELRMTFNICAMLSAEGCWLAACCVGALPGGRPKFWRMFGGTADGFGASSSSLEYQLSFSAATKQLV